MLVVKVPNGEEDDSSALDQGMLDKSYGAYGSNGQWQLDPLRL